MTQPAGAPVEASGLRGLVRRVSGDQRIRFLAVGGVNTVVGYGVFSLAQLTVGHVVTYFGSLLIAQALASILGFFLYRRFVFQVTGRVVGDFLRFQSVYIVPLLCNLLALPILVGGLHWNVYVAQASIVVVTTVVSFFGHKYFSFRRDSVEAAISDPAEHHGSVGEAAASTPDRRVYVSLAALAILTWGTAFLAPNSLFWDDWVVSNGDTLRMYQQLGLPWMGPIYAGLLAAGPWAFKVIALASTVFVACALYRISGRGLGLRRGERWLLAALTIALPLNSARESVAVLETYSLSLAMFAAAWYLLVRKNPWSRGVLGYAVASLLLIGSYSTESLLPFTLLPVGHLAYLSIHRGSPFWRQVLRCIARFWYIPAAPIVFWAVKTKFFTPTGVYRDYNSFTALRHPFSVEGIGVFGLVAALVIVAAAFAWWYFDRRLKAQWLSASVLSLAVVVLGFAMELARSSPTLVSRVVPLAIVGCGLALLACSLVSAFTRRVDASVDPAPRRDRELTPILSVGIAALAVGVLPYLLVGKLPSWSVWDTRHQLLMPIGVAVIVVATARALGAVAAPRIATAVSTVLLLVFVGSSVAISLAFVADWNKQEQVITALSHEGDVRHASTIVFADRASGYNYDDRQPNFYEYNGWLERAFGNQKRLGLNVKDVPGYLSGTLLAKVDGATKRYGYGEFTPSGLGALVTISRVPGSSWWGLLLNEHSVRVRVRPISDLADVR